MKIINYIFFLILQLFLTTNTIAQQESDYIVNKKLYTNVDGLPSREITCITQDKLGYMWFGTRNGLCRYDGHTFIVFTKNNGLLSNHIKAVFFDNNTGLIITYESATNKFIEVVSQVNVLDIKLLKCFELTTYYKKCPFKSDSIREIVYSKNRQSVVFYLKPFFRLNFQTYKQSAAWELSNNQLFKKYNNLPIKATALIMKNKRQIPININSIASYNLNQASYVLFNDSTLLPNANKWSYKCYWHNGIEIVGDMDSVYQQHYYASNNYGSLHNLDSLHNTYGGITFNKNYKYINIINDDYALYSDNNNTTYLFKPFSKSIKIIDSADIASIAQTRIIVAFKDNLGNRWLGTNNGIIKLNINKQKFKNHFTLKQTGLGNNHSTRGCIVKNKKLYGAVYDFIGVENNTVVDTLGISGNFSFLNASDTCIWAGSFYLSKIDILKGKVLFKHHSFKTGEIWSMYQLNPQQLLLGGTDNIRLYNILKADTQHINIKDDNTPHLVYRFFKNSNTEIYAIADNGIFVLNTKAQIINYYSYNSKNNKYKLPFEHMNDVYKDADEPYIYWIATTNEGLYKWNQQKHTFIHYGLNNGFLSEICYRIEADKYNNLWVSTDYGLAKFNKQSLQAIVYTEKDGIAHNEFNRGASYQDSIGMIYFGGIDGLTSFNPKDFRANEKKNVPFVITNLKLFNTETNTEENELPNFWTNKQLNLAKTQKNLSIYVALLDYEIRPHQYAYQIQGYNKQWQYTNEGKITINSLPYGNYVIVVKAQNLNGIWLTDNLIKIPIHVIRPYNETWWFYSLVALFIILLIALIFYLIYKSKIKNLKRLSDLRLTIASDLHDQVGGLLNKAAIQSELMQSKQKENNAALSKIAMNNRTALSSMRDIIWNLDPRNDSSESLVDRMNDYAQKMLEDDFDYTINVHAIENIKLNHEIRQNLNMIFKESINNIVKHAQNSQVKIDLKIINNTIVLVIFNSGNYYPSEKRSGQGLWNMEMRAKKMKGQFTVCFDEGVEICVIVPISH